MSQDTSVAEATISDEELELELDLDGSETEEERNAKLANAEKAKKQILARARKAEAELKALKEKQTPDAEAPKANDDERLWEIAEYIQQGYTRQDAEFIQKNGGREALKDANSYVSVALRQISQQRKAEHAASAAIDTTGMSEVERKYTPEQLAKMPLAELEALLPKADY